MLEKINKYLKNYIDRIIIKDIELIKNDIYKIKSIYE